MILQNHVWNTCKQYAHEHTETITNRYPMFNLLINMQRIPNIHSILVQKRKITDDCTNNITNALILFIHVLFYYYHYCKEIHGHGYYGTKLYF
jgi:short-subunit dehydrogenase involved in D-alanine esterification of teichoic acids